MTQRDVTRRRIIRLLGTATIGSIAGCAGGEQFSQQDTETSNRSTQASPTATPLTQSSEQTATRTPTNSPTSETPTGTTQATEPPATEPPADGTTTETRSKPGYKDYHWHGRLFFEIDGDLVDFSQSKYYLKNLQQKRPETVYFHFHDSLHGVNEWSNEKKTVTFARALNLLPTIKYARRGGSNVITYKGQTYRASRSGTSIDIYRGTDTINPQTYTVQHDDNFWVRIGTRKSRTAASSTRSGTFIVAINNQRLTFTSKGNRQIGTTRFGIRADGPPYTWYSNGEPVTLAEALNTLPEITYRRRRGGTSEITYTANNAYGRTYRETSDTTTILTRQRWTDVDPQSYELQDGDIMWVYIHTSQAPDNEH